MLLTWKIVITERYVVDSIASIAYTVNDPNFPASPPSKLLLKFLPRNAVLIHLDATYEEIAKRRGGRADPKDYVEFHRSVYDKLSKTLKAVKLNTAQLSVEEARKRQANPSSASLKLKWKLPTIQHNLKTTHINPKQTYEGAVLERRGNQTN